MRNELINKINTSTAFLEESKCAEGFIVMISGGKDSSVLKHLVKASGLPARFFYLETTMESDIMANFLKTHHSDVTWIHPPKTVYELIREYKVMPSPFDRFCCREILHAWQPEKIGTCSVYGKRSHEAKRSTITVELESILPNGHKVINPLLDWTDEDVDEYLAEYGIPIVETYFMYGKSFNCSLCPNYTYATKVKNIERYPEVAKKLKSACYDAWLSNKTLQVNHSTAESYWYWFLRTSLQDLKKTGLLRPTFKTL